MLGRNFDSEIKKTQHINNLGNESGYRRLGDSENILEGDETFGIFGQTWTPANNSQIGEKAKDVGGFFIWRRKLNRNEPKDAQAHNEVLSDTAHQQPECTQCGDTGRSYPTLENPDGVVCDCMLNKE